MKKVLILIVTIFYPITIIGQSISVNSYPKEFNEKFYTSIEFMTSGEIIWQKESEEGISYRVVILRSEIYNSLDIEEIRHGILNPLKINFIKNIDLYALFRKFELKGEISDVKFDSWVNATTCVLKIKGKRYELSNFDKRLITVKKL